MGFYLFCKFSQIGKRLAAYRGQYMNRRYLHQSADSPKHRMRRLDLYTYTTPVKHPVDLSHGYRRR